MAKIIMVFLIVFVTAPMVAVAQNTVVIVPLGDTLQPISIPGNEDPVAVIPVDPVFLDEAIGIPLVFNKGWDTSIGHRTKMDPSVKITLRTLEPVFGYPGITFTPNEIRQWGEQRFFNSPKRIYAKAALMIDRGNRVEGGVFEWSLNNQGFISFHNIVRKDNQTGWIGAWTDPRPGDKVWFFIMSDDERFSSNPISFIWP